MRIGAILLPCDSNLSDLARWGMVGIRGEGSREVRRPARYVLLHYLGQVGAGGSGGDD